MPCKDQYVSTIFPREKKEGTHKFILNLKQFNEVVNHIHFKMDTLKSAIHLMEQDCWFPSTDFKDAFYSIPMAHEDRKYLRFWNDKLFHLLFKQWVLPPPNVCSQK